MAGDRDCAAFAAGRGDGRHGLEVDDLAILGLQGRLGSQHGEGGVPEPAGIGDPGLRERHFGAFQGRTFAEIEVELPEHAWHWRKRTPDWTPPDGGESLVTLHQRIVSTVDELAARHPGQQIVMVAHGGVLDILYRAATRLDLQAPRTWELTNTAVNRLLWTPQGLSLVGWGDTSHLEALGKDETTV